MSAARVGRAIADSYTDYYMKGNADWILAQLMGTTAVTFSVVDIEKAVQLDAAYEKMNEAFLKRIVEEKNVLTDMSRSAMKTMRYAGADYAYYNSIDLGTYMDYLSEIYPEECAQVRELLKEAVLYTRSNHYLAGSQGLAIYFPASMDKSSCLYNFTDYVYNISQKKYTNALYYYKVAGCLNEEMKEAVQELTGKSIKTLNTKIFYDYQKIKPDICSENELLIPISEELQDSIQNVYVELANYDEEADTVTYYGTDDCCEFDGDGNIRLDVDAQWFALDGTLLDAKFSFRSDTTSTYITKVIHNDVPSYMTVTVNHDTEEITIDRVVKIPESDSQDYDAALLVNTELNPGDEIIPILRSRYAGGDHSEDIQGETVKYGATSGITLKNLPDGEYLHSVIITDLRGDAYYSPVVEASFKSGKSEKLELNPNFVDRDN